MLNSTEKDVKRLEALGRMLTRQAKERAVTASAADNANEVIDLEPMLPEWQPGTYDRGDIVTWDNEPVWCVQGHDSTATPDWTPAAVPALWAHYHGRDAAHARPIAAEGHTPYNIGHYCTEGGTIYRSKEDGNVYAPSVRPQDWEEVA